MLRRVFLRAVVMCGLAVVAGRGAGGQETVFDDNFSTDPLLGGWMTREGVATWVPPGAPACVDPNLFDRFEPCSLYPAELIRNELEEDPATFGGYVLITPAEGGQYGIINRREKLLFDDFKLEMVVELRDGSIGRPADGMQLLMIDTELPAIFFEDDCGLCYTAKRGMVLEFDNWSCNSGDFNDDNHVSFAWSSTSFLRPYTLPPDVFVPLGEVLLHNRQDHPAEPNRFRLTLFLREGLVTADLEAVDQGIDLGRLFTYSIPDYPEGGFEGYLAVNASTGGAWQNHILHSIRFEYLSEEMMRFVRGDVGADGAIDISDSLLILHYLFLAGAGPPCMDAADVDDSGQIDITDVIFLLNWLFRGGPFPAAPAPASAEYNVPGDCGSDPPGDDGLDCALFPLCLE